MTEIDFVTFRVNTNGLLLKRATQALTELSAFGDMELRSAWLYYGSISAASKALTLPISTYRTLITPNTASSLDWLSITETLTQQAKRKRSRESRRYLRKLHALQELDEEDWSLITDGALMILDLPDSERVNLFRDRNSLPLTKGVYTAAVQSWKKSHVGKWKDASDRSTGIPIEAAKELVEQYVRMSKFLFRTLPVQMEPWEMKRRVRLLMEGRLRRYLLRAARFQDRIQSAAGRSKLYAAASTIIREYENYSSEKLRIAKHIERERRVVERRREEFLASLRSRDGSKCKACASVQNLLIDHALPLSLGGFSALDNLQLLCAFCNGSKGDRPMSYLETRMAGGRHPSLSKSTNMIIGEGTLGPSYIGERSL